MLDRNIERIRLIKNHCDRIIEKSNNINLDEFKLNKDIQDIVLFNLLQIGELSKSLTQEFINKYNKVPWKQIKGTRDVIVHGYESMNYENIYYTMKIDIAKLNDYCVEILSN